MREPRYPLPRVVKEFGGRVPRGGARSVFLFSLARIAPGVRFVFPLPLLVVRHDEEGEKGNVRPGHHVFAGRSAGQVSTMILPQVHLRKPCYDFSFL